MIGKLKGIVDSVGEDWVIVDVGGVGYHVTCSRKTLSALPAIGEPAALAIETYVREDQIRLFGFARDEERNWFRLLLGVQGVGTRMALGVLSVFAPDDLAAAIAAEDKKAMARAPGVGPKLAGRIVSELKDKVPHFAVLSRPMPPVDGAIATAPSAMGDAVSALVHLGYGEAQALSAVIAAGHKLEDSTTAELLIRQSLKELAR